MTSPPSRVLKLKRADEQPPGLLADQRGATMVMGVFIAVLLVAMIYYVWGIGDVVMYRERMQDASDTAAFSAAVIHARGMNMLALLNMVMAALAMVAATIATAAAMIGYAAAAAGLVCAFCPECTSCCSACPYAVIHGIEYEEAHSFSNRVNNIVTPLMRGLHGYAVGIRDGVPLAAQAKVVAYGTGVYSPVTEVGMMAPPTRLELPAQDDETNWPCDNKVLPTVRIASPIAVWIWGTYSPYMLAGIAIGELDAQRISRQWCQDGYFQRITDNAQQMGNDQYQVQAYMLGQHDLQWTSTGVAIATWGQNRDAGSTYTNLAQMGKVSFAQAEFFYDDGEPDWHEWLWHMNWRARLRRWRVEASGMGGLAGACGSGCGALGSLGGNIDSLVVH